MKSFLKGMGIGLGIGILLLSCLFLYIKFTAVPFSENSPEEYVSAPEEELQDPPIEDQDKVSAAEPTQDTEPAAEPETVPPSEVTLAFAGDVMLPEQYLAAYDASGIQAIADPEMLAKMQEADLFMLNEEFPFSLRGEPMADKQFTFRTDPAYVKIFQDLGADAVTVANNHALDFGKDAFCDTLDALAQAGIACVGGGYDLTEASAPLVRTIGEQSFAIFAATRVSPSYDWYATDSQAGIFQTYDPSRLNEAIKEADALYDHVIVFLHWGIEKNETPEEYQRTLARGYIDAGADLVLGCHPHVLQGFEYYKDVPIAYSLGNYLFGNRSGETLLLNAIFSSEGNLRLQLVPCQRVNGILTPIQDPAGLYQHLTDLSFHAEISESGILSPINP